MRLERLAIILLCCIYSCTGSNSAWESSKANAENEGIGDYIGDFFHSKGVLVFNTSGNLNRDTKIFNFDNSLFATFNLAKNGIVVEGESESLSNFSNADNSLRISESFFPKEFYPDQLVIQFEYTDISNGVVTIILDKKKGISKRIILEKGLYTVEPWKMHLIGCMVDFNSKINPIKKDKLEDAAVVDYNETDDVIFIITEISGDWIRIECAERCDFQCSLRDKVVGWVRWKKEGNLLIKLSYSC